MDWDFALTAFVTLFVVIDPLGVAPIYASMTADYSPAQRWSMALKGTLLAALILALFAFGGETLLTHVGIGLPAFRTAGGVLLFLLGLEMIFEHRTNRRSQSAEHSMAEHEEHGKEDISVFPLAIPLLAGPGSMAAVVLLMTTAEDVAGVAAVFSALALVLIVTFPMLGLAAVLLRLAGESAAVLITRVMGVLLAALAVQFVFDGIKAGVLG